MYKLRALVTLLLALFLLTGCTYSVQLINFDSGETLQGGFDVSNRDVWVNLADGTKLSGKYVEIRNDSITFGTSSGSVFSGKSFGTFSSFSTGYSLSGPSLGYAILRNPSTKIMMEVLVRANLDNTGMGEARTNDGKTYKVIF